MNRSLIRLGFLLFLLSLLTGFLVPALKSPRLALSAHTIAVLSSLVLIAVGIIWNSLRLGAGAKRLLFWLWVLACYGNWLGTLLAAMFGGSQLMPIAGANAVSSPGQETVVMIVIISIGLISIIATLMVLWGLRGNSADGKSI